MCKNKRKTNGYIVRKDVRDCRTSVVEIAGYTLLILIQLSAMYYAPELILPLIMMYVLGIVFIFILNKIL